MQGWTVEMKTAYVCELLVGSSTILPYRQLFSELAIEADVILQSYVQYGITYTHNND